MTMKTKMNDALAARSARGARPHDQMMRSIEALWNGQGRGEEAGNERAGTFEAIEPSYAISPTF